MELSFIQYYLNILNNQIHKLGASPLLEWWNTGILEYWKNESWDTASLDKRSAEGGRIK